MLDIFRKAVQVIGRDFGLVCNKKGSYSRGTPTEIGRFHDSALEVFRQRVGLWNHEELIIKEFFPPPPATVLDVGCGTGRTSEALAGRGYRVVGIDLSEEMIKYAQEKAPQVDYSVMNATQINFPDNSFDAAFFSFNGLDCVAPLHERLRVLREIRRVVRLGGVFHFSSHNIRSKFSLWKGNWTATAKSWYEALNMLLWQVGNSQLIHGYWWYHDSTGWQLLFSGSVRATLKQLVDTGWTPKVVASRDGALSPIDLSLKSTGKIDMARVKALGRVEHHVQYVAVNGA